MSTKALLIRGRWIVVAVLLLAAWLMLRYTRAGDAAPAGTAQAAPSVASQPAAQTLLPSPSYDMSGQLSRDEVAALVVADLSNHLSVGEAAISIAEIGERVWYNDSLGCWVRSGVPVDPPIPGYLIRLEHESEAYSYHTDRQGHFIRCPAPSGPRDRTTR